MQSETTNISEQEKPPLDLAELSLRLKQLQEVVFALSGNHGRAYQEKDIVAAFIAQLHAERTRLNKIFQTEKGSEYFVLNSGECLRYQPALEQVLGPYGTFKPVMEKIFFVGEEGHDLILPVYTTEPELLISQKIPKVAYSEGAHPVEVNILNFGGRISYTEDETSFTLKGTETKMRDGSVKFEDDHLYGGFHLGHKIVKVEK